jgi:2-dehydropantoate 2-reductase
MRITVFGAGAVGGMIAARLAAAGQTVSLIARGQTLGAIKADGLRLRDGDETYASPLTATDDPASLPAPDVLILTLKAHQIEGALPQIRPLVGADTLVVPAINGLPFWYFDGLAGDFPVTHLTSLDPTGTLSKALPAAQLAGCVVYVAAAVEGPGEVLSTGSRRLILGPVDAPHPTLQPLSETLIEAGFDAPISDDIRRDLWVKLWGNLWANPLSVLGNATVGDLVGEPLVCDIARRMMGEARTIAGAVGVTLDGDIEARINQSARGLPNFRTSMLQDFDRGRPIELEAILGSVRELAQKLDIPAPTIDAIYGLTRLRAKTAGLG